MPIDFIEDEVEQPGIDFQPEPEPESAATPADLSKIKIQPWQEPGVDIGPWRGGEAGRQAGLEEAAELPAAVASAVALPVELAGKAAVGVADIPTRLANVRRAKQGREPLALMNELPRPQIPRIEGGGVLEGAANAIYGTANQLVPVLAPPEIGLTLPIAGAGGRVGKLAAGAFGTAAAGSLPVLQRQTLEVLNDPTATRAEKAEAVGNLAIQGGFAGAMLKAAGKTEPAQLQGPLATGEVLRQPEGAKPPPQTEIVIPGEQGTLEARQVAPEPLTPRVKMVAAAYRSPDGKVITGMEGKDFQGVTHMEADMAAQEQGIKVDESMAGFLGDDGRFYTREEAYEVAKDQVDPSLDTFEPGKLHSGKMTYSKSAEAAPKSPESPPEAPKPPAATVTPPAPETPAAPPKAAAPAPVKEAGTTAQNGKVNYRLPATGKSKLFIKWNGQWFKSKGGVTTGKPIDPNTSLVRALDEQLAMEQPAPAPVVAKSATTEPKPETLPAPTLYLKRGNKLAQVTPEAASRMYGEMRNESGAGASELGPLPLYDANGTRIGHVSYNGKVWLEGNDKPLYEPVTKTAKVKPAPVPVPDKVSAQPPARAGAEGGTGSGKEPWQMTRGEVARRANIQAKLSKDLPPQAPPEYLVLKAISDKANRKPYNPDLLQGQGVLAMKKAGFVSGVKNLKLTDKGRNQLNDWARDQRDYDLAYGTLADEAIDAALDLHKASIEQAGREGKPIPAEVLADYPDLVQAKPQPEAQAKAEPGPEPEVKPAAKVEAEVQKVAPKWTMTFEEFLEAPREGELLEAMRSLPKREKSAEEIATQIATDDAYAALEKAKLTWMVDHPEQGAGLSKAKRKVWDAYNKAWKERGRVEKAHQEEAQRFIYDELVKRGDVRNPAAKPAPPAPPAPQAPPAMPEGPGALTAAPQQGAIGAPPLAPSPAPSPALPPKAISQIIRDLAKGLGVPIRFGRLRTTKFAGYFKPIANLIGSRRANDMPTVSHEVGHKLDQGFKFSGDPAVAAEINMLGDPATPGSMSSWTPSKSAAYKKGEGVAEFIRYWLTDPSHASKIAPNMHAAFEAVLRSNVDMEAVMRQAQKDVELWRTAEPQARLRSSISIGDNPNKTRYTVSNLTRDLVDDLHFLRLAVDDAKISGSVPPSQNPYLLARLLRGSYGMADSFIRKGIVDFKSRGVTLGTSLEDALKPIAGRIDDFRDWIVAKRAQELHARGKQTGLLDSDVNYVASKFDSDAAFNAAFSKVKAWNDALLQYAVDSKLVAEGAPATATSPASGAHLIRQLNQDYVPFHRVFEVGAGEPPATAGVGIGKGLNVGKPGSLRTLKGSPRDIVDPLETMIKNAYSLITASEKNAINIALADLSRGRNMGKWVESVATPKEAVRVELDRIRTQLESAGADLSKVPDDLLMLFFKPSGRAPFGENIIKVNRGGKLEFYRLQKDLFDTFNALDVESTGKLIQLISVPAQLLRAGVTTTPDFALANAMRDTMSAAVISRYGMLPFTGTLRGISALLRNPQLVSEWAASGGRQAVEASYFDRTKLQRFLTEKITKDLTPAEQALVVAKSPLTALRYMTSLLEEATRVAQYDVAYKNLIKQGWNPGEARRQAAFAARDLQDFAKGGAHTKILRRVAAFWNAGLQANVRLAQAFKERPLQTIAKGLAFVTLPKLIEQALNWNDDDYWDKPQWQRDLFYMIPVGNDANGHTKFMRIPVPFEIGVIFATIPGRFLQWGKQTGKEAFDGIVPLMLKQGIPVPSSFPVIPILEAAAGKQGYSYWRGRPIVPESLKQSPPELQVTEQTSLTARRIGALLGISPIKTEYIIGAYTGGLGRQIMHQGMDRGISAVTGEKRPTQAVVPFGRFSATPAGAQSQSIELFYDALNDAEADAARRKAGTKTTGLHIQVGTLRKAADEIAGLRKMAMKEQDPDVRQRYQLAMVQIAKTALVSSRGARYQNR